LVFCFLVDFNNQLSESESENENENENNNNESIVREV
jgi:hypothetical protein